MSDPLAEAAASAETSDVLAEAVAVLAEAGTPLHYRELTRRIQRRGRWMTSSRNPEAIVNNYLSKEVRASGEASRFSRTGRGIFQLRSIRSEGVAPAAALPNGVVPARTSLLQFGAGDRCTIATLCGRPLT